MPPRACAEATTVSARVVFPDDSGPKISTTRPRGKPPTPRGGVHRQHPGRDRRDINGGRAEPHDGAAAVLFFDLAEGDVQRAGALVAGLFLDGGFREFRWHGETSSGRVGGREPPTAPAPVGFINCCGCYGRKSGRFCPTRPDTGQPDRRGVFSSPWTKQDGIRPAMTSRLIASLCVANRSEYARKCLPIRALSAGRLARLGARPTLSTDCQDGSRKSLDRSSGRAVRRPPASPAGDRGGSADRRTRPAARAGSRGPHRGR